MPYGKTPGGKGKRGALAVRHHKSRWLSVLKLCVTHRPCAWPPSIVAGRCRNSDWKMLHASPARHRRLLRHLAPINPPKISNYPSYVRHDLTICLQDTHCPWAVQGGPRPGEAAGPRSLPGMRERVDRQACKNRSEVGIPGGCGDTEIRFGSTSSTEFMSHCTATLNFRTQPRG